MRTVILCFLLAFSIISCNHRRGSGHIVTEKRNTGDFRGISVGGAFSVQVKTGPETDVTVESDDNVIGLIETRVSGGVLQIRTKGREGFNNATFKVYITAPVIKSIEASGAANVKVNDPLKFDGKVSLDADGASEIIASVDAPEVHAEVDGAAKMELSGRTRDYKAEVSGSGDLRSGDLKKRKHRGGRGWSRKCPRACKRETESRRQRCREYLLPRRRRCSLQYQWCRKCSQGRLIQSPIPGIRFDAPVYKVQLCSEAEA